VDHVCNVVHTDRGFFSFACCSKLASEWLSVISEFALFQELACWSKLTLPGDCLATINQSVWFLHSLSIEVLDS
jgi:hypothetical protein